MKILLLSLFQSFAMIYGASQSSETDWYDLDDIDDNEKVSINWSDLGFKVICEEEEWKRQFKAIEKEFSRCIKLSKIIIDDSDKIDVKEREEEEEEEEEKISLKPNLIYTKPSANPYCRIAKNWDKCLHLLDNLDCIEPDPKQLENKKNNNIKELFKGKFEKEIIRDPYNWKIMNRPYKMFCSASKLFYKSNPLKAFGQSILF